MDNTDKEIIEQKTAYYIGQELLTFDRIIRKKYTFEVKTEIKENDKFRATITYTNKYTNERKERFMEMEKDLAYDESEIIWNGIITKKYNNFINKIYFDITGEDKYDYSYVPNKNVKFIN